MATALDTSALPCPVCRLRRPERRGGARIGNNRNSCSVCNNWAQNVMRMTRKRLKERHPDEYEEIRRQVERDLYPQVLDDYTSGRLRLR